MTNSENNDSVEEQSYPIQQSATFAGGTLLTMGLLDLVAHLGPTGLLVGGLASYAAFKHGPELYAYVREKLPAHTSSQEPSELQDEQAQTSAHPHGRSLLDRAFDLAPQVPEQEAEQADATQDEPLLCKQQAVPTREAVAVPRLTLDEIV